MEKPKCFSCNTVAPADATHCSKCFRWLSAAVHVTPSAAVTPADHTFRPTFFEHLGPEGTLVSSRRELRETCKQHGVISHRLEF